MGEEQQAPMNIPEAAHSFFHEFSMLGDRHVDDTEGAELSFHEWCEANEIEPKYRNAIWQEVARELGVEPPGAR